MLFFYKTGINFSVLRCGDTNKSFGIQRNFSHFYFVKGDWKWKACKTAVDNLLNIPEWTLKSFLTGFFSLRLRMHAKEWLNREFYERKSLDLSKLKSNYKYYRWTFPLPFIFLYTRAFTCNWEITPAIVAKSNSRNFHFLLAFSFIR